MEIAVLGAGTMGRGIACFFAKSGMSTVLYDPYQQALTTAQKELGDGLKYTVDLEEAVSGADFIIESAPESLEVKRELYRNIAPFIKKDVIIASNTSTYPLSELSQEQPFAGRMLIAHFFNPAQLVPLVEIVKSEITEVGLADRMATLLRKCGKVPVILKKDIRGFIANRLQAAVVREACYLLKEDVATAQDIDTVMKESIGMRWALSGPFEIADYGGLDVWAKVLYNLLPVLDNTTEVPDSISDSVAQHNLGFKTGKGFFDYDNDSGLAQVNKRNKKLIQLLKLREE